MKTRYITAFISVFIAAAMAMLSSCTREGVGDLAEYSVNNSYVSIPKEGGEMTIEVNATVDWFIDTTGTAKWLSVTPVSGTSGLTKVKFSAGAASETHSVTMFIANKNNQNVQYLYVSQVVPSEVKLSTCKEVLDGKDGKEYTVKGKVASIVESAKYGRWYIADETGTVYIYGTRNAQGDIEKGALVSYGLEVGDEVTVQGPRKTYGTTVELADVYVLKIVKSLIKFVGESEFTVDSDLDTVSVRIIRKGNNLDLSTSESWLSILSTQTIPGVKGEEDTTVVNVLVAPNGGEGRNGKVTLSSSLNGQTSVLEVSVTQIGAVSDIADVKVGKPAHVIGQVTAICSKGFVLTDNSASILYFHANYAGGFSIGDSVEVKCAKVAALNKGMELDGASCLSVTKLGPGSYNYPSPLVMTAAELDAAVATKTDNFAKYVSMTGILTISGPDGKYQSISVEGTTNQGSVFQITPEMKAALVSGKVYQFEAYLVGVSNGIYANLMLTSAKEVAPSD